MKPNFKILRFFAVSGLALAFGLHAAAPAFTTSEPQAKPAKGTPIRGEPIRKPSSDPKASSANDVSASTAKPAPDATRPAEIPVGSSVVPHNGFLQVGFEKLSTFNYVVPEENPAGTAAPPPASAPDQIPGSVRALNQKLISLKGYMLPLKVEGGLVTEMLMMKDQSMCCFGGVPKINEWVSVKMSGKGVKAVMDQPVTLFGKLYVGEVRENGYLVGIYRMDGERLGEQDGL